MEKSFIETVVEAGSSAFTCEVYPPRDEAERQRLLFALKAMREGPCRGISVTCSAKRAYIETLETARLVRAETGLSVLVHVPCGGLSKADFLDRVVKLTDAGFSDLLIVRGDPVERNQRFEVPAGTYQYAAQAIASLRLVDFPVRLAAACHPEGHGETEDVDVDFQHLVDKVSFGVDLLIGQMAYDASLLERFVSRLRRAGVSVPFMAGILPLASFKAANGVRNLGRISVPESLAHDLESASDARSVGLGHALELSRGLKSVFGIVGVHLFRTMDPGSLRAFGQVFERLDSWPRVLARGFLLTGLLRYGSSIRWEYLIGRIWGAGRCV